MYVFLFGTEETAWSPHQGRAFQATNERHAHLTHVNQGFPAGAWSHAAEIFRTVVRRCSCIARLGKVGTTSITRAFSFGGRKPYRWGAKSWYCSVDAGTHSPHSIRRQCFD
jgi:hypothetical protein